MKRILIIAAVLLVTLLVTFIQLRNALTFNRLSIQQKSAEINSYKK